MSLVRWFDRTFISTESLLVFITSAVMSGVVVAGILVLLTLWLTGDL